MTGGFAIGVSRSCSGAVTPTTPPASVVLERAAWRIRVSGSSKLFPTGMCAIRECSGSSASLTSRSMASENDSATSISNANPTIADIERWLVAKLNKPHHSRDIAQRNPISAFVSSGLAKFRAPMFILSGPE